VTISEKTISVNGESYRPQIWTVRASDIPEERICDCGEHGILFEAGVVRSSKLKRSKTYKRG
jgi:hypothetical protein